MEKKLIAQKLVPTGKGSIATPVNDFITKKKLTLSDISSIHFNSDLSAAVIIYHTDIDTKVEKEVSEGE